MDVAGDEFSNAGNEDGDDVYADDTHDDDDDVGGVDVVGVDAGNDGEAGA